MRVMKAERAKIVASLAAQHASREDTAGALKRFDDGEASTCLPFPGGAWALEITPRPDEQLTNGSEIEASVSPTVYVHDTRIASAAPIDGVNGLRRASMAVLSDYDGDGIPELWLRFDQEGVESGHDESAHVLTVKGGAIVPYAPAGKLGMVIERPVDADGDGRMDLPTAAGIRLEVMTSCERSAEWEPARFLAHALPDGTFSLDDGVAKKAALAWCPEPPKKLARARDALCLRLWSHGPAEIAAARKRVASCKRIDCKIELHGGTQPPGADDQCTPRIKAFDATPPLSLP